MKHLLTLFLAFHIDLLPLPPLLLPLQQPQHVFWADLEPIERIK